MILGVRQAQTIKNHCSMRLYVNLQIWIYYFQNFIFLRWNLAYTNYFAFYE